MIKLFLFIQSVLKTAGTVNSYKHLAYKRLFNRLLIYRTNNNFRIIHSFIYQLHHTQKDSAAHPDPNPGSVPLYSSWLFSIVVTFLLRKMDCGKLSSLKALLNPQTAFQTSSCFIIYKILLVYNN